MISRVARTLVFSLVLGTTAFAPAQQYQAVLFDCTSASPEVRLLAMTLAGIVNRDSARLYLLNCYETWSYNSTDETWRDTYVSRGNVVFESIASAVVLVDRFRPYVRGGVSYDAAQTFSNFPGQVFRWQGEYAALIGGLTDRLPVTPSLAALVGIQVDDSVLVEDRFDGDPPVQVTCRLDLPSHPWNNPADSPETRYLTLLDWGVTTLLPRCNPQKLYIREITDFTVRHRMFQVNLAGTDDLDLNSMPAPRADILERVLTYLHAKNPGSIFHIYGWIRPEPMTQWFAWFGASFHETFLANLSWHSSFPVTPRSFALPSIAAADTAELRDRSYILFVSSEGDASNWHFSFQSGAWLSPERGTVPIGWGWNFELFAECPFVAAYYFDTATPNDGFLAVTSPLGYAYPDLWQNDVWTGAVDSTRALIDRFGVRQIYGYKHYAATGTMVYRGKAINNSFNFSRYGQFQAAIGANITFVYDPLIASQVPVTGYGSLMLNHVGDGSFYGDASDLNAMASRIIANIKKQTRPAFLLAAYQRFRQDDFANRTSPGSSDISIPRLHQVVQLVKADPVVGQYVEVVTPQTFSSLLRKKVGLAGADDGEEIPGHFALMQNYPNPFNPTTGIRYQVPGVSDVKLVVYDVLGREVAMLVNERKPPGAYETSFNASRLSSGVYVYRLTAGQYVESRRMVLIK